MRHILMQPGKDCYCSEQRKGASTSSERCPVCVWGARVCTVCGAAECELLDMPECPGHRNWRQDQDEGSKG